MAASFDWGERNGTSPGSNTFGRTDVNWKSVDDSSTPYTSAPVVAGQHSFKKFQFGRFQGTYNQVLNVKWDHTAGTPPANVQLYMGVKEAYATPNTSDPASDGYGLSDKSSPNGSFPTGALTVQVTGTQGSGYGGSTSAIPAYTEYLVSQIRTQAAASPGDIPSLTLTLQYDEN